MSKGSANRVRTLGLILVLCASETIARGQSAGEPDPDDGSFGMTTPVVCKDVKGYEDYEELPGAALTCEDKLIVYFRPRHFKTAAAGTKFRAHFTQDGKIRRRGEKAVLWQKANLLNYNPKSDTREMPVYLKNTISLKALKPGEYQYEITLRDEVGKSAPALRTVYFKVVSTKSEPETTKGEPR